MFEQRPLLSRFRRFPSRRQGAKNASGNLEKDPPVLPFPDIPRYRIFAACTYIWHQFLTTAANTNGLALLHLTSIRFELDGSNESTALQKRQK